MPQSGLPSLPLRGDVDIRDSNRGSVDLSNVSLTSLAYKVRHCKWGWDVVYGGVKLATYPIRVRAVEFALELGQRFGRPVIAEHQSDEPQVASSSRPLPLLSRDP